jgi:eukaryotic-like serine/threonine-protein kinase
MGTQNNASLPEGLEIGGYRILRKIASGGFSIVYLAEDERGMQFAIKEYLPASLVKRGPGELVPHIPAENIGTYRNGLRCFFEEGRALARIQHPNVVRVQNFFRANETVYMVMNYERGRSLQDIVLKYRRNAVKGSRMVLPEKHLRRIFLQVMNGLREVHTNRLLHLDVKPSNIYLRMDGSPIMLDFGAARQTLEDNGQRLFPMYTPGFAAPELYRKQHEFGPWTDVYGIGASMFASIVGSPPQPADQRYKGDKTYEILHNFKRSYSVAMVEIIGWCLRLNPMERPQSIFAVQRIIRDTADGDKLEESRTTVMKWFNTVSVKTIMEQPDSLMALTTGKGKTRQG